MKKQLVKLHFPEVGCYIGNNRLPMSAPITVEVSSADDIKNAIKNGLPSNAQFRILHDKFIQYMTEGLLVEFEDGRKIPIEIETKNRYLFNFTPVRVSDSMFEKGEDHLTFRFGNAHHMALYRLAAGNIKQVSDAALNALINVDLVSGTRLTAKGDRVLKKVWADATDVANDIRGIMTFAKSIVEPKNPYTPMFEWAKQHEYVTFVSDFDRPRQPWYYDDLSDEYGSSGRFYPTTKGATWLETNIELILKHQSCSAKRRKQLIEFLPEAHLPKYLTHDDDMIRYRAEHRFQTLNPIGDS